MFIDHAKIRVKAGDGGNGCISFRREKFIPFGGPDGGDGGDGGDVICYGSKDVITLMDLQYNSFYKAENGRQGQGRNKTGSQGNDCIIILPLGTQIYDTSGHLIADIVTPDFRIVLAEGGKGGKGNVHFASSRNRAPRQRGDAGIGEEFSLVLELKLIADFALVGYPNAGKSTLISVLSDAVPKIAPYPFTTLTPNLGVLEFDNMDRVVLADVPGLIEGAHSGVGLGFEFLRHIERCRGLIYVCDVSEQEGRRPSKDFRVLQKEISLYNKDMLSRPSIIVANKMDCPDADAHLAQFKEDLGRNDIIAISALDRSGCDRLVHAIHKLAQQVNS